MFDNEGKIGGEVWLRDGSSVFNMVVFIEILGDVGFVRFLFFRLFLYFYGRNVFLFNRLRV